jgi:hypothetical protein
MVDAICRGAMVGISEEVNKRSKLGYVESHVLYEIFKRYMVSDMDANRVC